MSTEVIERPGSPTKLTGSPRVLARPALSAILLLAEVMALSFRFDARTIGETILSGSGGDGSGSAWAAWLLAHSSLGIVVAMTGAAAALFFGRRGSGEGPARDAGLGGFVAWPLLALHFGTLAIFWRMTSALENGTASGVTWVVAWALVGLLVAATLSAAMIPPRSWGASIRLGARTAAIALAVGASATAAGLLARELWKPLGRWTFESVHLLLAATGLPIQYVPSEALIGTETFSVTIAPECSGYEGIGLVLAFLAAYLWLDRRRLSFPRAWLLLPIGTVAIWSANILRITTLILLGTFGSPGVALGGFHSQAGWLAFNAVALGLLATARRLPFFARDGEGAAGPLAVESALAGPSPEGVYLAPMLAIVAASMIGAAFSAGGVDLWYPIRLAAVAIPFWAYRREYAAIRWSVSWAAPAIGGLVFLLWIARWPAAVGDSSIRLTVLGALGPAGAAVWLAARAIGSAVTVPIAEELAFRGFLARRILAADFDSIPHGRFTWISFVLSSVAFGVLHGRWIEGTIAGMLYAYAYRRRGSLGDAVVAHATTNALLGAEAILTGDWSLFS